MRVVVFNALSWKRSGPVRVTVYPDVGEAAAGLDLYDGAGKNVPVQLDIKQRHKDGSIASAELLFVARGGPLESGMRRTMRAGRRQAPASPDAGAGSDTRSRTSSIRSSSGAGGVKQIVDRELNEPLLETGRFLGGELFTMQSVGEDAGEWSEPQQPTMEGFDRLGNHAARWRRVESGPVRDVVEARYALAHATVVQRVILFATIKRIDFEVSLLRWDGTKYREFRLAFPVRADQGRVAYEVPFGTLEVGVNEMKGAAGERYTQEVSRVRPRGIQNWIGLYGSRARRDAQLIGGGVGLHGPDGTSSGNAPAPAGAACLAKELPRGRSMVPAEGGSSLPLFPDVSRPGWQSGQRQGVEANAPLIAVVDRPENPEAHLPESGSFVSLDADNLVLSTMKKCEDDETVIVRVFDTAGKAASGHLAFFAPVRKAEETNLLEDVSGALPSEKNRVAVQVGAYEIRTMKITPAR